MEKRAVDTLLSDIQNAEFILAQFGVIKSSSVIYGDTSVKVTITFKNGVYLPDEYCNDARCTIKNNKITYLFGYDYNDAGKDSSVSTLQIDDR